jgi:hypothetical protein
MCRHGQVVRRAVGSDDRVDRPAHRDAATGLLVCIPCGGGVRIPLGRPTWVRPAPHLRRAGRPVRVQRVPSHRARPAPHDRPSAGRVAPRRPSSVSRYRLVGYASFSPVWCQQDHAYVRPRRLQAFLHRRSTPRRSVDEPASACAEAASRVRDVRIACELRPK